MLNSDPEGQIFLSTPTSHCRFFFLHTLPVFIAFCHFKCEILTNILTETRSFFCSCSCTLCAVVAVIHYAIWKEFRKYLLKKYFKGVREVILRQFSLKLIFI